MTVKRHGWNLQVMEDDGKAQGWNLQVMENDGKATRVEFAGNGK